jgi:hypothetical protein
VIAPPGVRLTLNEGADPGAPGLLPGWRRVTLPVDSDPDPDAIDDAEPVCISTREALECLGSSAAPDIKCIMIAQLSIAIALYEDQGDGPLDKNQAALSKASNWVLNELRDAFPDECWDLPCEGLAKRAKCRIWQPPLSNTSARTTNEE